MPDLTGDLLRLMTALVGRLVDNLAGPVRPLAVAESQYFLIYCAATVVALAGLHFLVERRDGSVAKALSAKIWWHPSARADYRYHLVNMIIWPAWFVPFLLSTALMADAVGAGLGTVFGDSAPLGSLPGWAARALYTGILFIVYDMGRFAGHWLMHVNPVLWEFHKVHHSAECLTPITSSRAHPVELVVQSFVGFLLIGTITGLFVWAAAGAVGVFTLLGANVFVFAFRLLGNLRHTHVRLGFGPLERYLVSPSMHQIHHSALPEHRDVNMGLCFAWWDRMAGSWVPSKGVGDYPMGLGDGTDGEWHSVRRLYWWPFLGAWQRITGRLPRFRQRLSKS